jgi:hypothetical protein
MSFSAACKAVPYVQRVFPQPVRLFLEFVIFGSFLRIGGSAGADKGIKGGSFLSKKELSGLEQK